MSLWKKLVLGGLGLVGLCVFDVYATSKRINAEQAEINSLLEKAKKDCTILLANQEAVNKALTDMIEHNEAFLKEHGVEVDYDEENDEENEENFKLV